MPQEDVIAAVVENCKRLIRDAHLLLKNGSPGAAMSLAILAIEEAGKGNYIGLEIEKPKRGPGWHVYRQVIAGFVLTISVLQKYGVPKPEFPEKVRQQIEERWAGAKTIAEAAAAPISEDLQKEVVELVAPHLQAVEEDVAFIFITELRWAKKLLLAAACGEVERQRQRGIYVDYGEEGIESDPNQVTKVDAYRWIRIAQRVLLLLEKGDFSSPYGEMAGLLERLPRPLPQGEELVQMLAKIQDDANELIEVIDRGEKPDPKTLALLLR